MTEMTITQIQTAAKEAVLSQFGIPESTTQTGNFTFVATVEVPGVDEPQFVAIELTAKNVKGNKRSPGFDLDTARQAYLDSVAEKAEKAAEKAAAKAEKEAARAAKKAEKEAVAAE